MFATWWKLKCSGRIRVVAALSLATLLVGCSKGTDKRAIVQGTVTIDGELVRQGVVTFHPDEEGGAPAYGTILKDGTYALRIGQGSNVNLDDSQIPTGKYTATVAVTNSLPDTSATEDGPIVPGPRLSDSSFSNRKTSILKYEVQAGRNVINIAVDRAEPEDDQESEEQETNESESEEVLTTEEQQESEEEATSENDMEETS